MEYGYERLVAWKNCVELRRKIFQITKAFPTIEMRRVSQMNDAARSVKQNIQEGYFKSTKSYLNYLNISRGSLNELKGDIRDCFDDEIISVQIYNAINDIICRTEFLLIRLIYSIRKKLEEEKEE